METHLVRVWHRHSLPPERRHRACHEIVPTRWRATMIADRRSCALAAMLNEAPVILVVIPPKDEMERQQSVQSSDSSFVSVARHSKTQHDRVIAKVCVSRIVRPKQIALPRPLSSLPFYRCCVETSTEIRIYPSESGVDPIRLHADSIGIQAAVPEHNVVASLRRPRRSRVQNRLHESYPTLPSKLTPNNFCASTATQDFTR